LSVVEATETKLVFVGLNACVLKRVDIETLSLFSCLAVVVEILGAFPLNMVLLVNLVKIHNLDISSRLLELEDLLRDQYLLFPVLHSLELVTRLL
jgi:hypothetical protein